jgi:gamma-glutamyltranspeptidase/glutathione hydrolase
MAGVEILQQGGNAADAAVAVAAALNVTQPGSTGLGGDCFMLYYRAADKKILALNGSGRSPAALTLDRIEKEGFADGLPSTHAHTVTVPGTPAAWNDIQQTLGKLKLARVLEPAIKLAEEGYPVAPLTSGWWQKSAERALHKHAFGKELLIQGRAPHPGEFIRLPNLARSLRLLADNGPEPFYEGEIAEKIVNAVKQAGGVLSIEDLAAHSSDWVEPINVDYREFNVWECPPNGQGLAALIALNIARQFEVKEFPPISTERYHLLIECMRLAFADTAWHVADPEFYSVPIEELLSESYAKERSKLINMNAVSAIPLPGNPGSEGDTVYFSVTDGDGNGCSFINSNSGEFGSGIVPEGCGYVLQNRGLNFRLQRDHPNCLEPNKRSYHTIIPGMMTHAKTDDLFAVFGVMGGMMQAQGHLQVVSAMVDDDLDPQASLDRQRFRLENGEVTDKVLVEDAIGDSVIEGLQEKGHKLQILSGLERNQFGLGQIIHRDANGVFWGGSDPRGDGCAMGLL